MTDNSTAKTPAGGFILLLLLLLTAGLVYFCQAENKIQTEGLYPAVKPLIQGEFNFTPDSVQVKISEDPVWKRIAVFAYDREGWQVGIIKPVYDRTLTITRGDYPDFRVRVSDDRVEDFQIIGKAKVQYQGKDFMSLLIEAKEDSRQYGVQECLYPICTRCMDVCPVIKHGVLEMTVNQGGVINPVIHIQGCPRCGKCFEVCKVGVLLNPAKMPSSAVTGIMPADEPMSLSSPEDMKNLTY